MFSVILAIWLLAIGLLSYKLYLEYKMANKRRAWARLRNSSGISRVCGAMGAEKAKEEINLAMNVVWEAFSDAGFVLPYSDIEEQASP